MDEDYISGDSSPSSNSLSEEEKQYENTNER